MIIGTAFSPLFNAIGRPYLGLKYTVACVVALPISFYILANHFGVIGICTAWLTVYPTIICGMIHLTRHITGMEIGLLLRKKRTYFSRFGGDDCRYALVWQRIDCKCSADRSDLTSLLCWNSHLHSLHASQCP
jgi:hypothetical protein